MLLSIIPLTLAVCGLITGAAGQSTLDPDLHEVTWEGNNYYFVTYMNTWHGARLNCLSVGGDLASVLSTEELQFISQTAMEKGLWYIFWIGLYYQDREKWIWTDGSPEVQDYWSDIYGFPYREDLYMCGAQYMYLWMSGKGFENYHCGDKRSYVCKAPLGSSGPKPYPTTPLTEGYCPSGWIGDNKGNKCFKIVHKAGVTWSQARDLCRKETTGVVADLASIHNVYENSLLTSELQSDAFGYWLGLYRTSYNDPNWKWVDNSARNFENFAPGKPSQKSQEDCVQMWHTPGPAGTWANIKCTNKRGYVCHTYKDANNIVPTPPSTPATACDHPHYIRFEDSCYKLDQTPRTWEDAEKQCNNDGGNLASVHSASENAELTKLAFTQGEDVWIGFRAGIKEDDMGEYFWSDGWVAFYTNWASNSQGDGCVALRWEDGKWYDTNCTSPRPSFCRITEGEPITTPADLVGSCPGDDIGLDVWHGYGDYCYHASNKSATWANAQAECHKIDPEANLVSIHNFQENEFVSSLLNFKITTPYWLGMFRAKDMTYKWADGSSTQYVNWGPGEPNGEENNEHCVEMLTTNWPTKWNDHFCTSNYRFICKVKKLPLITEPPHLEDKCPEGWDRWGGHCYHFQPDKLVLYSVAVDRCAQLDSQATVASIHGFYESMYINTQMKNRSTLKEQFDYWIGLEDSMDNPGYDNWGWSDLTPLDYKAWAEGEPRNQVGRRKCVIALASGARWKTSYCDSSTSTANSYVCKIENPAAKGLSSGSVAGIVIGVLVAVIFAAILLFFILDMMGIVDVRKKATDTKNLMMGIVNPNYQTRAEDTQTLPDEEA